MLVGAGSSNLAVATLPTSQATGDKSVVSYALLRYPRLQAWVFVAAANFATQNQGCLLPLLRRSGGKVSAIRSNDTFPVVVLVISLGTICYTSHIYDAGLATIYVLTPLCCKLSHIQFF